jgi:hypothetical protein
MSSAQDLLQIKELLELHAPTRAHEVLHFSLCPEGVPQGVLIEVSGPARTTFLLRYFKENPALQVLWLETSFTLFPPHLQQEGLSLSRFVFVEAQKEVFSSLRKVLRAQCFGCLVSTVSFEDEKIYKALRLLAEKSGMTVFFLTQAHRSFWPIAVQYEADWKNSDELSVNLRRCKTMRKAVQK